MFNVSLPQRNLILQTSGGKNLMDLLIENGLPVASSCLGEGICSKCCVEVSPRGEPLELEARTLARNKRDAGQRLSCQFIVNEDLIVKTSYW